MKRCCWTGGFSGSEPAAGEETWSGAGYLTDGALSDATTMLTAKAISASSASGVLVQELRALGQTGTIGDANRYGCTLLISSLL